MREQVISGADARRIAVASQCLHAAKPFGLGKYAASRAIDHIGYVQIDTISVASRAHNHVLWSRVPNYKRDHLTALQVKDRLILEYWAHAAAYLPMQDYRYCLPTMEYFRKHRDGWPKSDKRTMQYVMDRIRNEGPLKSRDFEHPQKRANASWWDWKPAKLALQRLFFSGDILISHREGFQRVYDLPERILPAHVDTTMPSPEEYIRHLIRRSVRAHGLVRTQEIHYLRKGLGDLTRRAVGMMQSEGELVPVTVNGINGVFCTTDEILQASLRVAHHVKLLSPFDNLVIQRNRLRDLFGFDYQIEVYVPAAKRAYGYYCLPILMGDQFYGRVDVRADRKSRQLQVQHLHMEDRKLPGDLDNKLALALKEFAAFNNCGSVLLVKSTPRSWKLRLMKYL
jgi:uncharacterized protein YcaQ